jgi:4-carboxymuconolactone decarboxylase
MGKNSWDPAEDRLPPISEADQTPAQKAAIQGIVDGPRGRFGGPFVSLLRSPELLDRFQRVGEYLRWGGVVRPDLRELAILIAVRAWDQPHEFASHTAQGRAEGLSNDIVQALAERRRPQGEPEQMAVYDFCTELLQDHAVGDEAYARLLGVVGEQGMMEVVSLLGYYVSISMAFNVARSPLPPGVQPFAD